MYKADEPTGSFQTGLNASYNCVDRWAFKHPDKVHLPGL
jgi:hypothetical protein